MKRSYLLNLFKSIFRLKNIPALIYLILNACLISTIFLFLSGMRAEGLWAGIIVYAVAVAIGLSPLGECFLRLAQKCKRIKDVATLNRLEPLFMEVKNRALTKHPELHINKRTKLYIKEDSNINAFAVGRRTICVTSGLLELSDDTIKAVLGHEFGHLAKHDTSLILLISTGNMIVTIITTVFKIIITLFKIVMSLVCAFLGSSNGVAINIASVLSSFFVLIFVDAIMYLWTKLGLWLVMATSRDAEFEADAFSCDLGYTESMLEFFRVIEADDGAEYGVKKGRNLFAALSASHPKTRKRIQNITDGMCIVEF